VSDELCKRQFMLFYVIYLCIDLLTSMKRASSLSVLSASGMNVNAVNAVSTQFEFSDMLTMYAAV